MGSTNCRSSGAVLYLFVLMVACGRTTTSELKSGSNVNNGTGPVGDFLHCVSQDHDKLKFSIAATAAVTLKEGRLALEHDLILMKCDHFGALLSRNADSPIWDCQELRDGEALYRVQTFPDERTGKDSRTSIGKVTIEPVFPMPPKVVADLQCEVPEEK